MTNTDLLQLGELGLAELAEGVCVVLLNLAETHVADTVAHLSHIKQRWAQ